jgi:hypothetical protein
MARLPASTIALLCIELKKAAERETALKTEFAEVQNSLQLIRKFLKGAEKAFSETQDAANTR